MGVFSFFLLIFILDEHTGSHRTSTHYFFPLIFCWRGQLRVRNQVGICWKKHTPTHHGVWFPFVFYFKVICLIQTSLSLVYLINFFHDTDLCGSTGFCTTTTSTSINNKSHPFKFSCPIWNTYECMSVKYITPEIDLIFT